MPTFLRNFTKNSQIAVLQAKNAKITTQNLNEDKDGSLNKSMPSRKKADPQAVQRGRLLARLYLPSFK